MGAGGWYSFSLFELWRQFFDREFYDGRYAGKHVYPVGLNIILTRPIKCVSLWPAVLFSLFAGGTHTHEKGDAVVVRVVDRGRDCGVGLADADGGNGHAAAEVGSGRHNRAPAAGFERDGTARDRDG